MKSKFLRISFLWEKYYKKKLKMLKNKTKTIIKDKQKSCYYLILFFLFFITNFFSFFNHNNCLPERKKEKHACLQFLHTQY